MSATETLTARTADNHQITFDPSDRRGWEIADYTHVQHRGYVTREVALLVKDELAAFTRDEVPALIKAAQAELKCKAVDRNRLRGRVRKAAA